MCFRVIVFGPVLLCDTAMFYTVTVFSDVISHFSKRDHEKGDKVGWSCSTQSFTRPTALYFGHGSNAFHDISHKQHWIELNKWRISSSGLKEQRLFQAQRIHTSHRKENRRRKVHRVSRNSLPSQTTHSRLLIISVAGEKRLARVTYVFARHETGHDLDLARSSNPFPADNNDSSVETWYVWRGNCWATSTEVIDGLCCATIYQAWSVNHRWNFAHANEEVSPLVGMSCTKPWVLVCIYKIRGGKCGAGWSRRSSAIIRVGNRGWRRPRVRPRAWNRGVVCFRKLVLPHPGKLRLAFLGENEKHNVSVALVVWLALLEYLRGPCVTWASHRGRLIRLLVRCIIARKSSFMRYVFLPFKTARESEDFHVLCSMSRVFSTSHLCTNNTSTRAV